MAINNNDWTDELRDLIEGVELTPSEGGWDRLRADLHPRRAAWWLYAVPAAACLLLGGVFLFREQPSKNVIDVLAEGVPEDVGFADPTASGPSSYVAEVARDEQQASLCLRPEQQSFSSPEGTVSGTPSDQRNAITNLFADEAIEATVFQALQKPEPSLEELKPVIEPAEQKFSAPHVAAEPITENVAYQKSDSEPLAVIAGSDVPATAENAVDTAPDESRQVVEEESALPSLIVPAPGFDFEEEPAVRQRKQRRKITVTVSAGGVFGSAGNGLYIAQASPAMPVTKAETGRVMDITEVIQHSTPVQKAIGLSVPISDKMDIGTGVDHLELNSVIGPGSQNLEWVGVPLRLGYNIASWGPSSIILGAGFKGEKCLSATLLGMDYNEPFQWSANMGADLRVHMFGPISFSLAPELSYYFTETVLPTYRTSHPLTFTLHAGLSLNL